VRAVADAVHVERQAQRRAHGAARVERGERVLLDELDRAAVAQLAARRQDVAAPGDRAHRGRVDAKDHVGDGRLARPALADDRQALALHDVERDVVHGADLALAEREDLGDVAQRQKTGHAAPSGSPQPSCTTSGW
jgi:hypothetical protein